MEQKFTPGKWKQSHRPIPNDEDGMYSTQVYDEKGETIATLAWYPKPQVEGTHEGQPVLITGTYRSGNAQLISKSPEMYEMLGKLVKQLKDYSQVYGYDEAKLIDEAEQLINSCVSGV